MNGEADCQNGTDEIEPLTCRNNTEFACRSTRQCLQRHFVNDGIADCEHSDDENNANFVCFDKLEFRCNGKHARCIPRQWVRDGVKNCPGNEDEEATLAQCYDNEVACLDGTRCLSEEYLCDGIQNCADGSDEVELCESPVMYRYSDSHSQLMPWSSVLFHSLKRIRNFYPDFRPKPDLVKGFKCHVKSESSGVEVASNVLRTVPQFYILNNISVCFNSDDFCFRDNGFTCAKCFDGTVISKSQICDNRFDCSDLSDECPCEDSPLEDVCSRLLHHSNRNATSFDFGQICNITSNTTNQVCEMEVLDFSDVKTAVSDSDKYNNFTCYFHNNFQASYCDGLIDCNRMEDECSSDCLLSKTLDSPISSVERFEIARKCFPLLINETGFDSVNYRIFAKFSVCYDNDNNSVNPNTCIENDKRLNTGFYLSEDPYVCNYTISLFTPNRGGSMFYVDSSPEAKDKCSLWGYKYNLQFLCDLSPDLCPWLFVCKSDRRQQIDMDKRCDFAYDCNDKSDEAGCPEKTHFYCANADPLFIRREKVGDGRSDCSDRSDECQETAFSSAKEMLKNPALRVIIWIVAVCIIISNFAVLTKHYRKTSVIQSKSSVAYLNTVLLINLAFSDIIYGFTLLVIGIKSQQFSGNYCQYDLEWRSSVGCNVIGAFTIISSQTSLNLLTALTGLRLYLTFRPFMADSLSRNFVLSLSLLCWGISLVFACFPIWMEDSFAKSFYIERNYFLKDQVVSRRHLEDYVNKTGNLWTSVTNSSFHNANNDRRNSVTKTLDNWYFSTLNGTSKFPNRQVKVKGHFGYYSYSAVCFPNFYTQSSPGSEYSLAILLFNFFSLAFIVFGYSKIYFNTRKSGKSIKTSRRNKTIDKRNKKMRFRISLIILTDLLCWLPIIFMGFASYAQQHLPDTANIISTIAILPINSLLNPIIYSKLGGKGYKTWKKLICTIRCGGKAVGDGAVVDETEMTNVTNLDTTTTSRNDE